MDNVLIRPNDIHDRLALLHCDGIGTLTYQKLLSHFGNAEQSVMASRDTLQKLSLNAKQIDAIKNNDTNAAVEKTLEWLGAPENHILFSDQDHYPDALKNIYDAPPVLFVKGDWRLLHEPQISMVGSRNATGAGKQIAYDFAASLSQHGITITSGLASGIDAEAHKGALANKFGKTIAVVATGLDRIYPASNKDLAENIVANGAIISEFTLGTRPLAGHFPKRNRIISALSVGTLVVEAAAKSGSLITAKHALEQGKDVFAIPGSIHSPLSKGCHQLIRQGAKLVETVDDILQDLSQQLRPYIIDNVDHSTDTVTPSRRNEASKLDPEQQILLEAIDYEATAPDQILQRTGFSAEKISSMLLILELNELIRSEQGLYSRT